MRQILNLFRRKAAPQTSQTSKDLQEALGRLAALEAILHHPAERQLPGAGQVVTKLIEEGTNLGDGRIFLGSWEGQGGPLDLYACARPRRWP